MLEWNSCKESSNALWPAPAGVFEIVEFMWKLTSRRLFEGRCKCLLRDFWNFTELLSFPQSYEDITNSQQSSPLPAATDFNPFPLPSQVGNVNKYPLQLMGSS